MENKKEKKAVFLFYTPFTGLGLYGGFRGNRWLRNRISVFKQFVIPSLLNQTDRNFIHWIQWRPEDRKNPHVEALYRYLLLIPNYQFVFTFGGLCFWDDKYKDEEASSRLFNALKVTLPELKELAVDVDEVYMMIQPSDDLYDKDTVQNLKVSFLMMPDVQVFSYQRGYICNYTTKEVLEYNPKTNPPFFCIRFPQEEFFNPNRHMTYTGPYQSHEYVGDKLKLGVLPTRGFLVGTHGENISTHFNHPFGGLKVDDVAILDRFGISDAAPIKLPKSLRKWVIRKLPYQWQKKWRYWMGEKLFNRFYNFIRN